MSDDILLKTSFRGFDRKEVMDYIETIQKENRELKKRIAELEDALDRTAERPAPAQPVETAAMQNSSPARETDSIPDFGLDQVLKDANLSLEDEAPEEEPSEPEPAVPKQEPEAIEYENDVARAMSRADEAIASSRKSAEEDDGLYDDAVAAIYKAVMEAVSRSDEISVEVEEPKTEPEEKSSSTEPQAPEGEAPEPEQPAKQPVRVKVKLHPKKK